MTWYADGNNQSAAEAAHVEGVTFAALDLPSGYVRVHTRIGTINWGGHDWLGVGQFGSVSEVSEDAMLRPSGVTLTLSGVDTSIVSAAVFEAYHGRAAHVYRGFFNVTTLALAADPQLVFQGLMDTMECELGQNTGTINVTCEGELARWQRHQGAVYSHESQAALMAAHGDTTDRFFDQIVNIQNRTIDWSKKALWGNIALIGRTVRIRRTT